jgi:ArsR family transcriptional regulator
VGKDSLDWNVPVRRDKKAFQKYLEILRYIDKYQYMKAKDLALVFKALSHPHRLAIFLRLARCCQRHGCDPEACSRFCVGELGKGLRIGQPTVSHHLKELARAGLIRTRKCGQSTECWVTESILDELARFFVNAKQA